MTVLGRRNVSAIGLPAAALLWGCGMKGPPQAPLVRSPAPVTDLVVQRLGDEVSIGFTLPTANDDRSEPASLARVDVYAMTVQPRLPPDRTLDVEEFQEAATLVASIEVAPPPDPESDAPPVEPPPDAPRPEDAPVPLGAPVALTEVLTAEAAAPVDPWEEERRRRAEAAADAAEDEQEPDRPVMAPLVTPPSPGPLQREYLVVHVSPEGRESEGGERMAAPLGLRAPEPPPAPEVVYTATAADVTWDLPPGARETVQGPVNAGASSDPEDSGDGSSAAGASSSDPEDSGDGSSAAGASSSDPEDSGNGSSAAGASSDPEASGGASAAGASSDPEASGDGSSAAGASSEPEEPAAPPPPLESRPIVEWPPASAYELFEMVRPDDGSPAVPELLTPGPMDARSHADPRVEYGVERCYAVRTVDVLAGFEVRSRLSPATCVTFVDTFPPAAPRALTAIGSAGEVSLLWRPNDEADLAGYLVLRGAPGDETLQPLVDAPVRGNTYRDVTAEPGVRHVYAVRAVDDAAAPNLSEPSGRAAAAAR